MTLRHFLRAFTTYAVLALVGWLVIALVFQLEPPFPLAFRQLGALAVPTLALLFTGMDAIAIWGRRRQDR